jgi:hypothetical protein
MWSLSLIFGSYVLAWMSGGVQRASPSSSRRVVRLGAMLGRLGWPENTSCGCMRVVICRHYSEREDGKGELAQLGHPVLGGGMFEHSCNRTDKRSTPLRVDSTNDEFFIVNKPLKDDIVGDIREAQANLRQDCPLSIVENIAIGRPGSGGPDAVRQAARLADAQKPHRGTGL